MQIFLNIICKTLQNQVQIHVLGAVKESAALTSITFVSAWFCRYRCNLLEIWMTQPLRKRAALALLVKPKFGKHNHSGFPVIFCFERSNFDLQNRHFRLSWFCDEGDLEEPTGVLDRPCPCLNTLGDSGVVLAGLLRRL